MCSTRGIMALSMTSHVFGWPHLAPEDPKLVCALHYCIELWGSKVWMQVLNMDKHSMNLFVHCSSINLKFTWSLEVWSDWTLVTSVQWTLLWFCGLSLRCWVDTVPSHLHFITIPQFTVEYLVVVDKFYAQVALWFAVIHKARESNSMFAEEVCTPSCWFHTLLAITGPVESFIWMEEWII